MHRFTLVNNVIRILFSVITVSILSGCGCPACGMFEPEEVGEFKSDQLMINFLAENLSDFQALYSTEELCSGYSLANPKDGVPPYCHEVASKLGLVKIFYSHYYRYLSDGATQTFYYMDFQVYGYSSWSGGVTKSYRYRTEPPPAHLLQDSDLNTNPKDTCKNYDRFDEKYLEITDERVGGGWYLYLMDVCD